MTTEPLSTDRSRATTQAPLAGIRVVDVSDTIAGALASLVLADLGAEVIHVEPTGGSALRAQPAYPFWARGKKSIVLDLHDGDDLAVATGLVARSDVFVEALRPGVADRLGLGDAALRSLNPRLVSCSITGFGTTGPHADLKGYEGIVMAKVGGFGAMANMVARPGPAFAGAPFAAFGASQEAVHGILAALIEREGSGLGQRVEASLVQGMAAMDPCYFYVYLLAQRYPDAFISVPAISDDGLPNTDLALRGLVALTADGHWLQFSQVQPHMFRPFMVALGLDWMFDDPEWSTVPTFEDQAKRTACWEMMLEAARRKTLAEWLEIFEADANIWGEQFRTPQQLLQHPQLIHNGQVVEVNDPDRGLVRQLGPIVRVEGAPPPPGRAPALDEHGAELRHLASAHAPVLRPRGHDDAPAGLPLEGVTILELGAFFAGTYAATMLTDLGARVIKIEPIAGDPMRNLMPFPEAGGVKAMQGKESVAVDLTTPEGRAIVFDLARRVDVVVQSFRGGVVERLGIDAATLRSINPDLICLNAAGYGTDGPYADRPAFGMTIGAASIALRNMGNTIDTRVDLTTDEIKAQSMRMWCATSVGVVTCDGLGALGAATGVLAGLAARARGAGGQTMFTSMLASSAYAVSEDAVEYAGRSDAPAADVELHGFGALYRLYRTADGWVFLAAPGADDWAALTAALAGDVGLAGDTRFATPDDRRRNDAALAETLAGVFADRTAADWEKHLTTRDVACVVAETKPAEGILMSDEFGRAGGFIVDVEHPLFDTIPRLAPLVRFSRSAVTTKPGCLLGQHTDAVLTELGYDPARIETMRERAVIGS